MNKLAIPTILLATVMVAGIFAFMPVEQASSVHTVIQGSQITVQQAEDVNPRTATGDNQVSIVTIGTNNNTPFIIQAIFACGTSDGDNVGAEAEVSMNTISIDGDVIETNQGTALTLGDIISDGSNSATTCLDAFSIFAAANNTVLGTSIASDGGDIIITIGLGDTGDVLNSITVVALVDGSSTLTVTTGDPA